MTAAVTQQQLHQGTCEHHSDTSNLVFIVTFQRVGLLCMCEQYCAKVLSRPFISLYFASKDMSFLVIFKVKSFFIYL